MTHAVRAWFAALADPPEEMTRHERMALLLLSIVAGATRLLAVARTPWDWDEMLFILAMRDYDVAAHHPHPPGFPLFIGTARLLRPFFDDDFRALQCVAVAGALLLFPLMFLLARELRAGARTSLGAATLLAFFPNVWFFGGTALSDVPSLALCIGACALFLRGVRSPRALIAAGVVAGCAVAFRPQNAGIVIVPLLVAMLRRPRRALVAAFVAGVIAVASFAVAAVVTGQEEFLRALRTHQQYIAAADSFLAPGRPSLLRVADDFFLRPYRNLALNALVGALSLVALVRAAIAGRVAILVLLATFAPFCLFAWLFLDWNSASRFAIGYMPLFALLAAEGLRSRNHWLMPAGVATFVIVSAWWLLPALAEVRTHPSPPVAAAEWVAQHGNPATTTLYVQPSLVPYLEAIAPAIPLVVWPRRTAPVGSVEEGSLWLAAEGAAGDHVFTRERGALWNVARRRYFDVALTRVGSRVLFGAGWHAQEGKGDEARRWAARRSVAILPAVGRRGQLFISLFTPVRGQSVEIHVDGTLRSAGRSDGPYFDRELRIESEGNGPIVLEILSDRATTAAGDSRELSVRLESLRWSAE